LDAGRAFLEPMFSRAMTLLVRSPGMLATLALLFWGGPACNSSEPPAKVNLPAEAAAGLQVFQRLACDTCHSFNNARFKAGPALNEIYRREVKLVDGTTVMRDEDYLTNSILDADSQIVEGYRSQMVNYGNLLRDGELENLIALIKFHTTAKPESLESTLETY
jgi:cytochrome c2